MQAFNMQSTYLDSGAGQVVISNTGWLVYAMGGIAPAAQDSLVWVDRKGNVQPAAPFKAPFAVPRLSPDGQRIAFIFRGVIHTINVDGTNLRQILPFRGVQYMDYWTPTPK